MEKKDGTLKKIKKRFNDKKIKYRNKLYLKLYGFKTPIVIVIVSAVQTFFCLTIFALSAEISTRDDVEFAAKYAVIPTLISSIIINKIIRNYASFPQKILDIAVPKQLIDKTIISENAYIWWLGMKITGVISFAQCLSCIVNYLCSYVYFDVFYYYSYSPDNPGERAIRYARGEYLIEWIKIPLTYIGFLSTIMYFVIKVMYVINSEEDEIRRTQIQKCFDNAREVEMRLKVVNADELGDVLENIMEEIDE